MKILVTGASGFIGSHFCYYFSRKGEKIYTIERSDKPSLWVNEALENCTRIFGDLDLELLEEVIVRERIDSIVHFAAQSTVKVARLLPQTTLLNNILITLSVLEAARRHRVPKVILQSTDKVYGEKTEATVDDRLNPSEPYGTSKVCTDMIGQCYAWTYDMDVVIVRPCNIYGYDLNNRIIPNTIKKCMKGEQPITFTNDASTRQYLYVFDLIKAYNIILKYPLPLVVNVASSDGTYNQKEIVEMIAEKFDVEPTYKELKNPKQLQDQSIVSTIPFWKPRYSLEAGIDQTISRFEHYGF